MLPACHLSSQRLPFLDLASAEQVYQTIGGRLHKAEVSQQLGQLPLRRIIIRAPHLSHIIFRFGAWKIQNEIFTQYKSRDGQEFLNSSTPQLRLIQMEGNRVPHIALVRWSAFFGRELPEDIWSSTWLPFCSTSENTFLWQVTYRSLATHSWRFPGRDASDPSLWCTRCNQQQKEDVRHCLWNVPSQRLCLELVQFYSEIGL